MKVTSIFISFICISTTLCAQVPSVTNTATGKTWMDRNLGATQVATSSTDEASYGSLFQWGRLADGHELRNSSTSSTVATTSNPGHANFIMGADDWINPSDDTLWQGISGVNNPCPAGFRIPTEAEWEEERATWPSNDAAGALATVLKLPIPGGRSRMSGAIGNVGTFAGYRTSNLNGADSRNFGISLSTAMMGNRTRADGNSVRCIQDESALQVTTIVENNPINIFPNPTRDHLQVRSEMALSTYEIRTLLGNKIKSGLLTGFNTSINISALSAGVYFIRFENNTPIRIIKH